MAYLDASRPDDARARRSRAALQRALLEGIEKKPIDQISIREITAAAGVSYPTFFRNYASKEELVGDIAREEIDQILALMLSLLDKKDPHLSADAVCDYIQHRRALWTTLLTTSASAVMRDEFIRMARQIVRERGQFNVGLPVELAAAWVFAGLFEILAWWLRQPKDYPLRNVSQFLEVLVLGPSTSAHQFDLED
jgi:AcrR family transcriptional regulator